MSLAVVIAGIVVVLLALIWWGQEKLVFFPQHPPYPEAGGLRRIDYEAADGQKLFAYVVGDSAASGDFLISFHGNADLAVLQADWARKVSARTGYTVVLAEYRGYSGLGGKPTYTGTVLDAQAAYTATTGLGAEPGRIAFFGHSLGSAVAAELARKHEPRVLVLQAPFTSARDMAGRVITPPLALAFGLISRVRYDTRAAVAAVEAPVWVVHGTSDGVINVEMGRTVFAAARNKGELLIVDDAGHNDLAGQERSLYWAWLERALK